MYYVTVTGLYVGELLALTGNPCCTLYTTAVRCTIIKGQRAFVQNFDQWTSL